MTPMHVFSQVEGGSKLQVAQFVATLSRIAEATVGWAGGMGLASVEGRNKCRAGVGGLNGGKG